MALIKCYECGNEISDKAKTCIHCGCPLSEFFKTGKVKIKLPDNIADGILRIFFPPRVVIKDADSNVLWKGSRGEYARFTIDGPTDIFIDLGGGTGRVKGVVEARRKYELIPAKGLHTLAEFKMVEVDSIDSD